MKTFFIKAGDNKEDNEKALKALESKRFILY